MKVGEKTAIHSHPAYVAYVFGSYKARFELADGSTKVAERATGDVFLVDLSPTQLRTSERHPFMI